MNYCLFDAKPLSESMPKCWQLDPKEANLMKLESKYSDFHSEVCIEKQHVQNDGHFIQTSICQHVWAARWIRVHLLFTSDAVTFPHPHCSSFMISWADKFHH